MEIAERRARLEALATTGESESVRLRAFQLLAELDERAEREPAATFDPDAFEREQANDEERLTRLASARMSKVEAQETTPPSRSATSACSTTGPSTSAVRSRRWASRTA